MSAADAPLPGPPWYKTRLNDDSLEPTHACGTVLIFSLEEPTDGVGVLVKDGAGKHHFRRYRPSDPDGKWWAEAVNPAYPSLHSQRDGLTLVATLVGWECRTV